jgi:hypothetical protein
VNPSFIARFTDAFITGLFETLKDKLIDIGLLVAATLFWWATGHLSAHLWQDIPPLVWGICLVVSYHTVKASVLLWNDLPEHQAESGLTPIIISEYGTPLRFPLTERARPAYRAKIALATFIMLVTCAGLSYLTWMVICIREQSAAVNAPTPVPVSVTLGCGLEHIPIHVPSRSTVHVMRLNPAILYGIAKFPSIGAFEPISAGDSAMDWPSKREGRWMTREEFDKTFAGQSSLPTPWTFDCTLTNLSSVTLEDITATLIVDTADRKRHIYPIRFDPLMSGRSFSFYVVNVCSYGVTPTSVQWGNRASAVVLGEKKTRDFKLRFEERTFPSQLMVPGGSAFLWNGIQPCVWDRK